MFSKLFLRFYPLVLVATLLVAFAAAINLSLSGMARAHLLDWIPDRSTGIGFIVESRQRIDAAVRAYDEGTVVHDRPLAAFVGISDTREGVRLPAVSAAMKGRWRLIGVAGAGAGFPAIAEQGALVLNSQLRPDVVIIGCSPLTLIDVANLASADRAASSHRSALSRAIDELRSVLWLTQRRSDINAFVDRALLDIRTRFFNEVGIAADDDSRSPWRPLLRTLGTEHYPRAQLQSTMTKLRLAGAGELATYEGNAPALAQIGGTIRRMEANGAKVIIVAMPLNPMLRTIMPRESRDVLTRRLRQSSNDPNLLVLDFSDAVDADGFIDLVHLNTTGGERFSTLLGRQLATDNRAAVQFGVGPHGRGNGR